MDKPARKQGDRPPHTIHRWLSQLTLRWRIVLAVLSIVGLFYLASAGLNIRWQNQWAKQRALEELGMTAERTAANLGEYAERHAGDLRRIASDPNAVSLVLGSPPECPIQPLLESGVRRPGTDALIADANGRVLASLSGTAKAVSSELMATAAQGRLAVAFERPSAQQDVNMSLVQAMIGADKRAIGFVSAVVPGASAWGDLANTLPHPDSQRVYLVDGRGRFVALSRNAEAWLLKQVPGNEGLERARLHQRTDSPYADFRGIKVMGGSAHVEKLGLTVLVEQDYAAVVAPTYSIAWALSALMVVILALGTLISIWVAQRVERPILSGMGVIHDAIFQLSASASAQATGAQEQASSVTEVSATMDELSRTAEQIASNAEETLLSVERGHEAYRESLDNVAMATQRVDIAARQILALGEKSQRIGDISRIATEVADRIHLLAINAAIEAAGAGEYGRRFAVVASQVKELANATRQSSVQTQQLIDEMRNATNSAIMVTEQATKQIEVLSVTAERTRGALEEIVQRVEAIALATHQQRTASEQVVGTMHQVAEVTQQSAQSGRETLRSAENLDQAMHNLQRLIGDKES